MVNKNVFTSADAMSEKELRLHIDGCKRGDRLSQQWVFERYYRLMFGVCLRYTSDHDRVQDIVQEGFLKVFTNIEGFTSKGSFEGWIRRIMVNTAIDAVRKWKTSALESTEDSELERLSGSEEEEEPMLADSFTVQEVLLAMNKLSPAYRAVFNLYVFDNYSHAEIAEKLHISVGASKSNLAKAKRKIRHLLVLNLRQKVEK